ncbi:MAG TPA: hypothetical protein VMK82_08750 [Steroidobacteraceae bacterium]|nr:hypothetical protein [Steroidobacteraceae bacterium]
MNTRLIFVVIAALPLAGCMRTRIDESREHATAIDATESVVVLAKPQIEGAGAESEFLDCIAHRIAGRKKSIKVHPNEEFTDRLFPWFEPGTVPSRAQGLESVLSQPGVSEQVAASGVRYIVWLEGGTRKTDGGGSLACGAAPGAAGCIGFGWWEKESDYEATVWDLKQARSVGSVGTNITGTSAIVGAIVPLPFITHTLSTACFRLGDQLRTFLEGGDAAGAEG